MDRIPFECGEIQTQMPGNYKRLQEVLTVSTAAVSRLIVAEEWKVLC
jgi:hypothetical protein